jgi:ATP-dependent exoDNAse (exonuclease V) beta subunit
LESFEEESKFHSILQKLNHESFRDLLLPKFEMLSDEESLLAFSIASTIDTLRVRGTSWSEIRKKILQTKVSQSFERVRLLTIHGAKGLEFDTVIGIDLDDSLLPDPTKRKFLIQRESPALSPSKILISTPKKYLLLHPDTKMLYDQALIEGLEENLSLLYVLFTRAKTSLFLLGDPKKTSYFGWILEQTGVTLEEGQEKIWGKIAKPKYQLEDTSNENIPIEKNHAEKNSTETIQESFSHITPSLEKQWTIFPESISLQTILLHASQTAKSGLDFLKFLRDLKKPELIKETLSQKYPEYFPTTDFRYLFLPFQNISVVEFPNMVIFGELLVVEERAYCFVPMLGTEVEENLNKLLQTIVQSLGLSDYRLLLIG